jgi:virulence-associated protein VagC
MSTRYASLFRNGRDQAVRIPREFEFDSQASRSTEKRIAWS